MTHNLFIPSPDSNQVHPYLVLAEALFDGRLQESNVTAATHQLPSLNRPLLDELAHHSEAASQEHPRRGWSIAAVADAARHQPNAPFLQALAAWYLGRAANEWVRPTEAGQALCRARVGFARHNEMGWVAACDWQLNAIPWTRPNYPQAEADLTQALQGLEATHMNRFVPHCRLALAYAQLLVGNMNQALANIDTSEQEFRAAGDALNQARCWLAKSSCLRRQSHYQEARTYLQRALAVFAHSPIDAAKAQYQLAYVWLRSRDDYTLAEETFTAAAAVFQERDLPLWFALCQTGLAEVYSNAGRITDADQCLAQAREICTSYQVTGPLADSLVDSGVLEMLRGDLLLSLNHFKQAEQLYEQLGTNRMAATAAMFVGETCQQLGRYQSALHHLERAHAHLQTTVEPERLAECEMRLADIWSKLGHFNEAHAHLDAAVTYYRQTGQPAFLAGAHNLRAELFFHQNQVEQAISSLEAALAVAGQADTPLQSTQSQRLLGEALSIVGRYEEAIVSLQSAAAQAAEIGFVMEQAACEIALGRCYAQLSQLEAAEAAWLRALRVSQELMPDMNWQARAGLAQLAEERSDDTAALEQYRLAVQALTRLRQGFWQPALAGSYLHRPAPLFTQAVRLAVRLGENSDALTLIEAGKAQTILRQLEMGEKVIEAKSALSITTLPDRLAALADEIQWLKNYIRLNFSAIRGPRPLEEMQLRQQLKARAAEYEALKSRLERAGSSGWNEEVSSSRYFDLPTLRQLAQTALGPDWVAVDYYLADDFTLHAVQITPTRCQSWRIAASSQVRLALELCARSAHGGQELTKRDLASLANWLLPPQARAHLTPETYLIIAPHHHLHRLPWAALLLNGAGTPLVADCIPCLVPSLHCLSLLWQRSRPEAGRDGLILAVSGFLKERYDPLPAVLAESQQLVAQFGAHHVQLLNEAATWDHLLNQGQGNGLSSFAYWHIASHAFHDPSTGRLSGIALFDRDIWLDDLWQLAPLPGLVTVSACSGSLSRIHKGDEHIGLATTCLAAGAQSVIGSLWPIRDEAAAGLMPDCYAHILAGERPAAALALAQRAAIKEDRPRSHWDSFRCTGLP